MDIQQACDYTGSVICQFPPGEDECDTCQQPQKQLYFYRTCHEVIEGDYYCEQCLIKKAQEWDDFDADEYLKLTGASCEQSRGQ